MWLNNTVANDASSGTFVFVASGTSEARIVNNLFAGPGSVAHGPAQLLSNVVSLDKNEHLTNAAAFDYHLRASSSAINAATNPGTANGLELTPAFAYVHPTQAELRLAVGALDVGAYEFTGAAQPSSTP
jgi:hypothetical protein